VHGILQLEKGLIGALGSKWTSPWYRYNFRRGDFKLQHHKA